MDQFCLVVCHVYVVTSHIQLASEHHTVVGTEASDGNTSLVAFLPVECGQRMVDINLYSEE